MLIISTMMLSKSYISFREHFGNAALYIKKQRETKQDRQRVKHWSGVGERRQERDLWRGGTTV